jgi:Transposase DDE domain group 1
VKVQSSRSATTPIVTADGERLVSHAGVGMLAEVADLSGLTGGLSALFARHGHRWRRHPPGVTLARAAAAIADGMSNVSTVGLFCSSRPAVFESPAAVSTLRRAVFALGGELMTPGLDQVLAAARGRAWRAAGYAPTSLTIDVDATLLECHSDKEQAAPNYKSGFGYHPLGAWLDETREPLAMLLRAGNAGSNTAVDHCDVLERSLDQLPAPYRAGHGRGDDPSAVTHPLLVRADSAGATKAFLADVAARNIAFSVGFAIDAAIREMIEAAPEEAWQPAVNPDGTDRHGAQVVELCGFTGRNGWPARARLICRREDPHPGATLSLFDQIHGRRHTLFLTDSPDADIAGLELRHRQHARVEDRIRCWKATGATRQPYWDAPANEAWLNTTLLALTLIAWAQLIGFDGDLATAEPATFRTRVLHIAGQTASRARQLILRLDAAWPWATQTVAGYQRIRHAFAVP